MILDQIQFLEGYIHFLLQWSSHVTSIALAFVIWSIIIRRLLKTKHASIGANGLSDDIACGDKRVHRLFVIFGGPAGLSFGIPYFIVLQFLPSGGVLQEIIREYWIGFIYLQFITSAIQTVLLLGHSLFGKRPINAWRLFKSHWKGCGYVSAVSPVGWILYAIQQKLSNDSTFIMWRLRDVETTLVFAVNFVSGPLLVICLFASILNGRLIIPWIVWIDEDHEDDEDSRS
jgi:hypothetical protein